MIGGDGDLLLAGSTVYDAMVLKPASNGNANLTVSGNVTADNFSGSSSGTNTGDQTLPTDFVSAANGGTFGGNVTVGSNSLTAGSLDINGTADFSGKVEFQGDAAIEGGSGYGVFKGYTGNDNHFISVRGVVANSSTLSITGGHQTTFVEHADAANEGWYFKSFTTGTYREIARIDGLNEMYLGGNQVYHEGHKPTLAELGAFSTSGTAFSLSGNDVTAGESITLAGGLSYSGTTLTSADTTYTVGDGGLTQNNFTTTLKNKLDGIAAGATNVTNNNQLTNGAGYITGVTNISGYSGTLLRSDNRTIAPSEETAGRMKFGFTSWGNNNTSPYADFLHLRSYTDSSGGSDNLVMFKKSGIGMRIWQQTYGSATAYSTYEDVYHTGNLTIGDGGLTQKNFTTTLKDKLDGIAASATNVTNNNQLTNGAGYLTAETFSSSDVVLSLSGTDVIAGDSITLAGGLSYNASTKTLSQTDNNTVYTHPTSAGNKHIPTGGSAGQFLKYSSSGTAVWATPSYTTNTDTQLSDSYVRGLYTGGTNVSITAAGVISSTNTTYSTADFDAAGSAATVQSNLDSVAANVAGISNQSNTDVDTGTETIAQVSKGTYTAAFFDFVIKNGTNVRAGTVYSCHDGTNVEFTETSTVDLGDTSDVYLSCGYIWIQHEVTSYHYVKQLEC